MKKSQVKFGEAIGIVFIVYIVLVVGFTWYNKINSDDIREIYFEDQRAQAFEKYYFIVNTDLLHVSERGIVDEEFSLVSLYAFEQFAQSETGKAYLTQKLGTASITIKVYENGKYDEPLHELTLYERETPAGTRQGNIESFFTLVPVEDYEKKRHLMGVIRIDIPLATI